MAFISSAPSRSNFRLGRPLALILDPSPSLEEYAMHFTAAGVRPGSHDSSVLCASGLCEASVLKAVLTMVHLLPMTMISASSEELQFIAHDQGPICRTLKVPPTPASEMSLGKGRAPTSQGGGLQLLLACQGLVSSKGGAWNHGSGARESRRKDPREACPSS